MKGLLTQNGHADGEEEHEQRAEQVEQEAGHRQNDHQAEEGLVALDPLDLRAVLAEEENRSEEAHEGEQTGSELDRVNDPEKAHKRELACK